MKRLSTIVLFILFTFYAIAQQATPAAEPVKTEQKVKDKPFKEKKVRTKNGNLVTKYEFRPRVFLGGGLMKSFGEVVDLQEPGVHWLGNRYAFDAGISLNLSNSFDLNLGYMRGQLSGNENKGGLHRNFQSKFQNIQLSFTYNFRGLFGKPTAFYPYLLVGGSFMQYDVYQDLKGADGFRYYYWSNGEIYNTPEGQAAARNPYVRDFVYETKAYGKTQATFAIPLGMGIGFNISKKITLKVGSQYYLTFTDNLDGDNVNVDQTYVTNSGLSERKKGKDGYLYTYANISYNFFPLRDKPKIGEAPAVYFADFGFMNSEDADQDGVIDLYDKCLGTPKLIAVDAYGCPLDDDQDGIPNYLDKETNTGKNQVTDISGKAIDQSKISLSAKDTTSYLRRDVTEELIMRPIGAPDNSKFTVHVGTYGKNMTNRLMIKLNSIEGLVETKINDSLTVYTIGSYSDFKQAEARQNQLLEAGYDQAFSVNSTKLTKVSTDLNKLAGDPSEFTNRRKEINDSLERERNKPKEDVLLFKVELTEYRLRIGLEKIAPLIATYGVEMHTTTGGLKKYTIGGFKTPEEAEKLREEVIKLGLKDAKVAAYLNDLFIEMNEAMEKYKGKK
ncbi:MAG: hypothetical protein K1X82_03815 [Bacteroidia bacterium]|nr:hypothetical protein [Bacteroidia bacterium]